MLYNETKLDAFTGGEAFLMVNKRMLRKFSPDETIVLSNLIDTLRFCLKKDKIVDDGWFKINNKKQMEQTSISTENKLRRIKNKFRDLGIIYTKMKGIPAMEYCKIDLDKLDEIVSSTTQDPANSTDIALLKSTGLDASKKAVHISNNNKNKNNNKEFKNKKLSKDNFSTFSKQKVKRKRKKSSVSQEIKHIENKSLVEFWNEQPNLRTHRIDLDNPSKTLIKSLELLNRMKKGRLFKKAHLNEDSLFNVPESIYLKKYSDLEIKKAIKTLNEWYKSGNYPANKNCLKGLSLPDAIRNDRNGSSFLIQAAYKGVQSVYDPSKILNESEFKAYKIMEEFFLEHKKLDSLPLNLMKQITAWVQKSKTLTPRSIDNYTSLIISALRRKGSRNLNDHLFNELNLKLYPAMTPKALYPGQSTFEKIKDAYSHTEGIDLMTLPRSDTHKVHRSEQIWLNIVQEMYFREEQENKNNEEITEVTDGMNNIVGWIVRNANGGKNTIKEEIYREGDIVRFYSGSKKNNKIIKEISLKKEMSN